VIIRQLHPLDNWLPPEKVWSCQAGRGVW